MKYLWALLAALVLIASPCISHAQTVRQVPLPNGITYEYSQMAPAAPGYLFLGSYTFSFSVANNSSLLLLDKDGTPVVFSDYPLDSGTIADIRVHPNGLISYYQFNENTLSGQYLILDSTLNVIDTVVCGNGLAVDGHELIFTPKNNYMLICLEEYIMDVSSINTIDGIPGGQFATVVAPVIQELDPDGNLLFEWHGLDHYALSDIDPYFFLDSFFLDFGHANALAIDQDSNILLSLRFFNEVTKISREDSSIVWRLGGMQNDFTFVNDTQPFTAQHNCVILPNGNLTLYDNGEMGNPPIARAVEYELDQTNYTATKVWEHTNVPGVISYSLGSFQRLPNDNNLIAWGASFAPYFEYDVEEVDYNGNTLFALDWPEYYYTYRAYKHELNWDLEAKRPTIMCDTAGGVVTLTAMGSFDSYWWSTGDTTASINITQPGDYFVLGSTNNFPFSYGSKLKSINNLSEACNVDTITPGINSIADITFDVFPNPAESWLTVKAKKPTGGYKVVLYDALGQLVATTPLTFEGQTMLDVSALSRGSYIGVIQSQNGTAIQRFKVMVSR